MGARAGAMCTRWCGYIDAEQGQRVALDASELLAKLGSAELGPVALSELHLSRLAGLDKRTRYYPSEGSIKLQ